MKLGTLLASGKSFVNGGGAVAYREVKQVYLPKFVSPKNPFTSTAITPMEIAIAPVKKETAADPARTQKLPAPPRQKLATQTWVARLNPVSFWRASRSSVFSAQPVVQSELSLDSVKVVHNDLSDVDVEIVPIKSRASALAAKVTTQPAKKTWEVLGERIMRATAL
jgi:hypothetical protein